MSENIIENITIVLTVVLTSMQSGAIITLMLNRMFGEYGLSLRHNKGIMIDIVEATYDDEIIGDCVDDMKMDIHIGWY